jgi:hypothetical protein
MLEAQVISSPREDMTCTENGHTSSKRTWPGLLCFVMGFPNTVLFCLKSKKFNLHIFIYRCL